MYSPLDSQKREIRLLRILPSTDNDESTQIECMLSSVSLLSEPQYNALSYCWGSPSSTVAILVNGQPFHATKNLASALRAFRAKWKGKWIEDPLWVDAVCINQLSFEDKNQQLPLMRDIYVQARKTLVWLGDGESRGQRDALACKLIKRWAVALDESQDRAQAAMATMMASQGVDVTQLEYMPSDLALKMEEVYQQEIGPYLGKQLSGDGFDPAEYAALADFLGLNPYWSRIWIVQEFVLAQDLVLFTETDEIEYAMFRSVVEGLKHLEVYGAVHVLSKGELEDISKCISLPVETLISLRHGQSASGAVHFSLWELINLEGQRKSTNPLDMIYGLLGLIEHPEIPITIDYSMSPGQLFTEMTLAFLTSSSVGLNVLGLVGTRSHLGDTTPSWVPEFGGMPGIASPLEDPSPYFKISEWRLSPEVQATSKTLALNGVICAQISETRNWTTSIWETFEGWLDLAMLSDRTLPPCLSDVPMIQVLFRTLIRSSTGLGPERPSLQSDALEEELFFQYAAGFLEIFTTLLRESIENRNDSESDSLESEDIINDLLSDHLSAGELIQLITMPATTDTLKMFATWLALSPSIKLRNFTKDSVLEHFCGREISRNSLPWSDLDATLMQGSYYSKLVEPVLKSSQTRKDTFFFTSDGYMGLGPGDLRTGDEICCVPGCDFPLAVRRVNDVEQRRDSDGMMGDGGYRLLGACYVYGMMNGEVAARWCSGDPFQRLVFV
ncbi:heterokaryon incompatibility protein-domain-containing protein [Rhexocercosporidium sp. MPI-PUGE-AT-0058]|nr:heterokaryon incompatibility protein-domain-containing protein [Rhexocercosporidium sp. MPI-PUGE-AT-0058]